MFYQFKNQTDIGQDLYVYGDIVGDKWLDTDVVPEDFRAALDGMAAGQTLNMYINSGGGSVFAASAMVSMLKRAQSKGVEVHAYVDGLAASAASWLALAADKVHVYSNSMMMVHKPMSGIWGNANDMQKEIDALNAVEANVMLPLYREKAKVSDAELQSMIDAETWMGAEDIAAAFDVDLMEEEKQMAACASSYFDRYRHTPKSYMAFVPAPPDPPPAPATPEPVDYTEYTDKIREIKEKRHA